MFKKITQRLGLILFTLALGACATVEGMGEDLEDAGEAVQDAAEDNSV